MSIKLRFEKGSFSGQVVLKDGAWPELQRVINENQVDDEPVSPFVEKIFYKGDAIPDLKDPAKEDERINSARAWLIDHSVPEVLSQIGWQTNPEKILLLGASYEAEGKGDGWKSSDIETMLNAARQPLPGNFGRDIGNAIKAGIIAPVTQRTYKVSKTGWLKIYDSIIQTSASRAAINMLAKQQ